MTDQHLDADIIARAAAGSLSSAERVEALAHADICESCRADLTYVIGFERRGRRRRAAVITGVVLSLGLAVIVVRPAASPTVPSAGVRSGEEGIPIVTSYLPSNGADVVGDSVRFVWQDMGPDTHYRFSLSTATGAPVLDRAVSDTSLYVAVTPPVEAGEAYFWFVDALLADGGAARSSVWRFTIRE